MTQLITTKEKFLSTRPFKKEEKAGKNQYIITPWPLIRKITRFLETVQYVGPPRPPKDDTLVMFRPRKYKSSVLRAQPTGLVDRIQT